MHKNPSPFSYAISLPKHEPPRSRYHSQGRNRPRNFEPGIINDSGTRVYLRSAGASRAPTASCRCCAEVIAKWPAASIFDAPPRVPCGMSVEASAFAKLPQNSTLPPLQEWASVAAVHPLRVLSYQSMATKRSLKKSDFAAALVRNAYLPSEVPPAISTKSLAEFCKAEFAFLRSDLKRLIRQTTKSETFSAPRTTAGRRNLALVNPVSQLGMALLLTEHRTKIKKAIGGSTLSLYKVDEDRANGRAFAGLDFQKWDDECARIHSESRFVLRADVSRFFYTAYTHSIPWAIVGKAKAKHWLFHDRRRLEQHWSNDIDRVLQSCQDRETFGIPVGPDTSRVIAELLMAGIESDERFSQCISGRPAARLIDDFIVGFDDEESTRSALAALRNALWKFNLQLNNEKTKVIESRLIFEEKWKPELRRYPISPSDGHRQRQDIQALVDLTLQHCAEHKTDAPASWACTRLASVSYLDQNFGSALDALLRLARDFPVCTRFVVAFLINNQARISPGPLQERVSRWVKIMVKGHLLQGHDSEGAWCLLAASVLKIRIEQTDLPVDASNLSSVVLVMLGMLRERKLLSLPLAQLRWRAALKGEGVYGERWLLAYEAVRRKWTTDAKIVDTVSKDPVFQKMLAAKVSFLEDQVFNTPSINLTRRVFRRRSATTVGITSTTNTGNDDFQHALDDLFNQYV